MQLGMIGVGRMGGNMTLRLMRGGHECVAFARKSDRVEGRCRRPARRSRPRSLISSRSSRAPRAVWLMVPAAASTASIAAARPRCSREGDVADRRRQLALPRRHPSRAEALAPRGLHYVDVGTSGGVWGLENGYCLMVGGEADVVERLAPIFSALAPGGEAPASTVRPATRAADTAPSRAAVSTAPQGWLHCGPHGAGHFVKMVHNGIEYGLMAAYAEGLNVLKHANAGLSRGPSMRRPRRSRHPELFSYQFDLRDVTEVWRRGSVSARGCST